MSLLHQPIEMVSPPSDLYNGNPIPGKTVLYWDGAQCVNQSFNLIVPSPSRSQQRHATWCTNPRLKLNIIRPNIATTDAHHPWLYGPPRNKVARWIIILWIFISCYYMDIKKQQYRHRISFLFFKDTKLFFIFGVIFVVEWFVTM